MNKDDFQESIPLGDMLDIIFERQKQLMIKYHSIESGNLGYEIPKIPLDLNDPKCQQRIKDFMWRITEELGESANCLKNKPWKMTHMVTDESHFREELVDAVHFLIELLIMVGFTPETLTQTYLNKAAVNTFRQESKY